MSVSGDVEPQVPELGWGGGSHGSPCGRDPGGPKEVTWELTHSQVQRDL